VTVTDLPDARLEKFSSASILSSGTDWGCADLVETHQGLFGLANGIANLVVALLTLNRP
jgi:hypothetical protein